MIINITTVQMTLENKPYYPNKCKWCGKPFTKQHNKECYCSDECRINALREQKALYQRKRRKLINNGELISNENKKLGSIYFPEFSNDFDEEKEVIEKLKRRLRL